MFSIKFFKSKMATNFHITHGGGSVLEGFSGDGGIWKVPIDENNRKFHSVAVTDLVLPSFPTALDVYHNTFTFKSTDFNVGSHTYSLPVTDDEKYVTIEDIVAKFNENAPELVDAVNTKIEYRPHMNILHSGYIHIYWQKHDITTATDTLGPQNWTRMTSALADYSMVTTDDFYRVLGFADDQLEYDIDNDLAVQHYTATKGYIAHKAHMKPKLQHGLDKIYMVLDEPKLDPRQQNIFTRAFLNNHMIIKIVEPPNTIGAYATFKTTNNFNFEATSIMGAAVDVKELIIKFMGYSGVVHGYQYLYFNPSQVEMILTLIATH